MNNTNKGMSFYKKAMENKEILKGMVVLTQHDDELDSDILVMDLDGIRGVIKREDVDYQVEWRSLVGFVGMEVRFIVKEIDEDNRIVYCSRKEAQEMVEDDVIKRLKEGEVFNATITGLVRYGAYVEMEGIYGLLKNSDFSEDHVNIRDVMNVGDTINVKLNNVSMNNRITVEPVQKYRLKTVLKLDNFERNQVVLGTVNGIKPWGAYVTIAPGLDALCPIPPTEEIEEGSKVSFRITQVKEEEGRVRGKIVRVLN